MLVTYFVNFRKLNDHLFGKELFIRFSASAFRKLPSIYVFSYFPFGFEGRMWDLIVSVPYHRLSFYFEFLLKKKKKKNEPVNLYCVWLKPAEMAHLLRLFRKRHFQGKY